MNAVAPTLSATDRALDDWFSPILIKELRQGMRGRVFVISFLILQGFLILLVLGNVAAASDGMLLQVQTAFFWGILGIALTVLMPLRGLNAISQEVKHNTLETVLLTRLTAWRVVFGKWSALFAQSLLFATAVMPYIVVRYFIGGTDVVVELLTLLYFLWLSGIAIALAITASGITNIVIRILFVGASGILALAESGAVFQLLQTFSWITLAWLFLTTFFTPALLFELALAGIAPPSENHSAWRRLLALTYFGLSLMLWSFHPTAEQRIIGMLFPTGALVGICYFELSEKPRMLSGWIKRMSSFDIQGRASSLFLLPGWPSALLYSVIMLPFAGWGIWDIGGGFGNTTSGFELPLSICAFLGSVLIPICFCHLVWKSLRQVFFAVMIYNAALGGLALVLSGFDTLLNAHIFTMFLALFPSVPALLVVMEYRDNLTLEFCFLNIIVLAITLILLFISAMPWFRELQRSLTEEEQMNPLAASEAQKSERW